ncbi:2OG-Fe(II) oxygenase [Streptomyces sp. NBC_01190]|uniref:2OG-Fe(II) oxygenase n=1 Tax=Streptomyces sp. NBC_01190 TaxID=2903767 RepID=UPI0038683566|nr:2OG-Fe(II) oxygenase [Streptomyces sp. NBC_01190]
MELTFRTEDFAVFDDFLGHDAAAALWDQLRTEDYHFVHGRRDGSWNKVYGLLDGSPLSGPGTLNDPADLFAGRFPDHAVYPSGTATDSVVKQLTEAAPEIEPWTGRFGADWHAFSCRSFLYPQGAGLAWHDDSGDRAASFVFYAHPEWQASWGAELLISAAAPGLRPAEQNAHLTTRIGHYVAPRPNRLVVMRSGVPHMIKKVEPHAGDHVRGSVAGFFLRMPAGRR